MYFGTIDNCAECCVHTKARGDSEVLGVVKRGERVAILAEDDAFEFDYICTSMGLEGFVCKTFIVLEL